MRGATYDTALDPCPSCGVACDRAMQTDGQGAPAPGDLSVCLYCGTQLRLDESLRSVCLSATEYARLPPAVQAALDEAVRLVMRLCVLRG